MVTRPPKASIFKTLLGKKWGDMAWWCWAHSAHSEDLSSTPSHQVGWLTGSQPQMTPDPRRLLIPLISKDTYTTVYKPTQRHIGHIIKNNQNFKEMLGEIHGCLCLWLRHHILVSLCPAMSKSRFASEGGEWDSASWWKSIKIFHHGILNNLTLLTRPLTV